MKMLILAGGYATRLWPITKQRAKPLLPLAGKPILDYVLDEVEQISEIDKIYVTTNERFEDSFENYLSRREGENYELIIESQDTEEEKYGAIGGIINVINNKEPDDYLVIGGDNYYSFKLQDFIDFSQKNDAVTTACYRLGSIEEAKNYGIVSFDDDKKIQEFQEKPENPKSRMVATACYFFPEEKLDVFDEYVDYWEGRIPEEEYLDEPGRFIGWTSEKHDAYAFPFTGEWTDVGTRQGYLRAEGKLRKNNITRGEVEDSELGENVTILEGSKVKDSEIEDSIIFEDCVIEDCIIKHSLIGEGTEIFDKDIRQGLVKDID